MTQSTDFLAQLAALATDRFWPNVERRGQDECWPWRGATLTDGRGSISSRQCGKTVTTTAPRLSFLIHNSKDPGKSFVCHSCDNPNCVNPAHLWLGDARANTLDAMAKGRWSKPPKSQRRTHCIRGHEFTEETTYWRGPDRTCRLCKNEQHKGYLKQWRAKRRQALEGGNQ